MLHSSIGIGLVLGISITRGQYCWILGDFFGIVLTLVVPESVLKSYLEATAADPTSQTVSKFVHLIAVQWCLLAAEVRNELLAGLQAALGVCRQDAWQKAVQTISVHSCSHAESVNYWYRLPTTFSNNSPASCTPLYKTQSPVTTLRYKIPRLGYFQLSFNWLAYFSSINVLLVMLAQKVHSFLSPNQQCQSSKKKQKYNS